MLKFDVMYNWLGMSLGRECHLKFQPQNMGNITYRPKVVLKKGLCIFMVRVALTIHSPCNGLWKSGVDKAFSWLKLTFFSGQVLDLNCSKSYRSTVVFSRQDFIEK